MKRICKQRTRKRFGKERGGILVECLCLVGLWAGLLMGIKTLFEKSSHFFVQKNVSLNIKKSMAPFSQNHRRAAGWDEGHKSSQELIRGIQRSTQYPVEISLNRPIPPLNPKYEGYEGYEGSFKYDEPLTSLYDL
jgi:hypothetical protein